jgi:hypothetical protein
MSPILTAAYRFSLERKRLRALVDWHPHTLINLNRNGYDTQAMHGQPAGMLRVLGTLGAPCGVYAQNFENQINDLGS